MSHRLTQPTASVFGSLAAIARGEQTLGPELCVPAFRPVCPYRDTSAVSSDEDPAIRCVPDSPGPLSTVLLPQSEWASDTALSRFTTIGYAKAPHLCMAGNGHSRLDDGLVAMRRGPRAALTRGANARSRIGTTVLLMALRLGTAHANLGDRL